MTKQILLPLFAGAMQICFGQAGLPKPCTPAAVNGGFEAPVITTCWNDPDASLVPGWNTTANDNKIEIWDAACMGVPAYIGAQFAELNANMVSSLYEEICTPCPNVVSWSFAHRGRLGTDVCELKVGSPGGPYTTVFTASDPNTAWGFYSGTYTVPPGQTVTRFLFESVSSAGGNPTYGNFLDAVNFTFSGLNLTSSQTNISCGNNFGSATVNPSGGGPPYTYVWSPSGGNAATATGLSAGTYTVIVTDAGGCSSNAIFNIISSASGVTATNMHTDVKCFGMSNGSAGVVASGGNSPYTYVWNTTPPQTSPTLSNLPAGTYSCLITDASGCSAGQSVTIIQPPPMSISATSTPASCAGSDGSASATASGGVAPLTYFWLTNPAQTTPGISNLSAGTYNVIITDANSCTQTQSVSVSGGAPPFANFIFTPDHVNITDPFVNFTDMSSNNTFTWHWYFGDGDSSTTQNPTHQYADTGKYCITLVVTDVSLNCVDTMVKCIEVDLFTFYVPNTFTPNGDGINDEWMPNGLGIDEQNYEMTIFDRWGNLIFYTTTWGKGWDGRANKGRNIAQQDVYVWKIRVKPENDSEKEREYIGNVNLVK